MLYQNFKFVIAKSQNFSKKNFFKFFKNKKLVGY